MHKELGKRIGMEVLGAGSPRDVPIRTRAFPVGASITMPPAWISGRRQSTDSSVVLPVPAGPMRQIGADAANSDRAAAFSSRARSSLAPFVLVFW